MSGVGIGEWSEAPDAEEQAILAAEELPEDVQEDWDVSNQRDLDQALNDYDRAHRRELAELEQLRPADAEF